MVLLARWQGVRVFVNIEAGRFHFLVLQILIFFEINFKLPQFRKSLSRWRGRAT